MNKSNRFLLIKAWGSGFWSDMEHVAGQLLIAELTDRIPVVYWGADSLYASEDPLVKDAFTMYFLPVSNYSVDHLVNENYTYYPTRWNGGNLRLPGTKDLADLEDAAIANVFSRSENVVVSNVHIYVNYLTKWIKKGHPAYGLGVNDIYSYLYRKYFKLQPYLSGEIEDFYLKNMKNKHPVIGAHIRGSDKIIECSQLDDLNNLYPQIINNYLKNNPTASIFLLTDCESILSRYKGLYGNKLIYTECMRTSDDNIPVHSGLPHYNKRKKGIDIIKDTYLALECDQFIGNSYSNVSLAVFRLKAWLEGTITLF
ncbi:O-fucosyltransferase family protein [Ectobacillus sp. sgz5001026]|uniref:O-fucosyltransferase family protein n=1 Tax=Ectobacillus sp. sgz5001026 TaxID=3242473 RepID=UPI0036D2FA6A